MIRPTWMAVAATLVLIGGIDIRTSAAKRPGEKVVDVAWRRSDGHAYAVTSSGAIYATPGYCQGWSLVGQVPSGAVPVSLLDGDVGSSLDIVCEDGQVFTVTGSVPNIALTSCSNVFGTP
jgi:hypothetical protein